MSVYLNNRIQAQNNRMWYISTEMTEEQDILGLTEEAIKGFEERVRRQREEAEEQMKKVLEMGGIEKILPPLPPKEGG